MAENPNPPLQLTYQNTNPWPLNKMPKLAADGSNAHGWWPLVHAMAAGRRASHLLEKEPDTENRSEMEQAANFKQFMTFTVDGELLAEISNLTPLERWRHLEQIAPTTHIEEVDTAEFAPPFKECESAEAFVRAHGKRHDAFVCENPTHYLASPATYIRDILAGLPRSVRGEILRDKYTNHSSKSIVIANELLNKVLELRVP